MRRIKQSLLGQFLMLLVSGSFAGAQQAVSTPPMELNANEVWMATEYAPKRLEQTQPVIDRLSQEVPQWFPPGQTESSQRYDNYHGADFGTVLQTNAADLISSLGMDYVTANPLMPLSPIMAAPPRTIFIPKDQTLLPGCELRSQVNWFDWGTCITGVTVVLNPACSLDGGLFGLMFFTSSLVEYRWPAYKIDTSEQPFASPYYPRPAVEQGMIPVAEALLDSLGPMNAEFTFNSLETRREIEEQIESAIVGATPAPTAAPARLDQNFADEIKKINKKYRHNAPSADGTSHTYGRLITEFANLMTVLPEPLSQDNMWRFVPHVAKLAQVGSDLPVSVYGAQGDARIPLPIPLLSGFTLSKFYFANMLWRDRFVSMLFPFGEWRCVANNKFDQKTPFDILLGFGASSTPPNFNDPNDRRRLMFSLFPFSKDDDMRDCIDKVGAQMAQRDNARPNTTDKIFKAMWDVSYQWRTFGDILAQKYQGGIEQAGHPENGEPPDNEMDGSAWGLNLSALVSFIFDFFGGGDQESVALTADNQGAWDAWRHLFRRSGRGADLYRFFPRVGEFANETPVFKPIDELTKMNWSYEKGGIKVEKSNGGQTAMVWPMFKGCFGRNLAVGGPLKGAYPFALPGISPLGLGPLPSQMDDAMKLY